MTDVEADRDRAARILDRPTPEAAAAAIESARQRERAVSLVGECLVRTTGSEVRDGESGETTLRVRHALIKPDGSTVVHGGTATAPTHRFRADGGIEASVDAGRLHLDARGPGVDGRVTFQRVGLFASFGLGDTPDEGTGPRSRGRGGHGALRERLLANPDLVEPGFRPLSTERETAAGPVDVYGRDEAGRAVVVEVKARRAGPAAVGQLDRYVSALQRDLHADTEVRGVLVAPSATERARALLEERGFAFAAVSTDA